MYCLSDRCGIEQNNLFIFVTQYGVLVTGPSGCGKTSLVKHIAKECDAFLIQVGDSVHGGRPGESEQNLRAAFLQATTACMEGSCILFLDDVDAICPRYRDNSDGLAQRMLAELLSLLEEHEHVSRLTVIAATSKPSEIDPCLRRIGRFEKEVENLIMLTYFPLVAISFVCTHLRDTHSRLISQFSGVFSRLGQSPKVILYELMLQCFLQARCSSCRSTNSVKTMKNDTFKRNSVKAILC